MITDLENELFAEWKKTNKNFSTDGVVNESLYNVSCKKLLFILKETNKAGEDFDLRSFLANGGRPQSWDNVTRWVMGIRSLDTDIKWSDIESIDQEQRKTNLSTIAVINMKKETGGHTTDHKKFRETVKREKELIKRQIDLYDADYIILCGAIVAEGFDVACHSRFAGTRKTTFKGISFVEYAKGKFAISYAHPEARVDDSLLYYGLIEAIREIDQINAGSLQNISNQMASQKAPHGNQIVITDEQFYNAVYQEGPLRFDGYRFQDCYRKIKNQPEGQTGFVDEYCQRFSRDFVMPEDTNIARAIYFFFQRAHKDSTPSKPYAPEDGKRVGDYGEWSHFYLAFLHLYTQHHPSYFDQRSCAPKWNRLALDGVQHEAATQVRKELMGARKSQPLEPRCANEAEFKNLANQASEQVWIKRLTGENPQLLNRPDIVMALSFKGNGFSEMMASSSPKLWYPEVQGCSYLAGKTIEVSSTITFSMENDENRAVMFLLGLWLLKFPKKIDYKSRDHLLFCLLYLHLYREPLSEYFTRKAFAKRWHQFTFDEKEAVAANMRRHLAQIRNEAAKAYPNDRPTD
jgi:hypothetical protein